MHRVEKHGRSQAGKHQEGLPLRQRRREEKEQEESCRRTREEESEPPDHR